jgi:hypothetical protein
MNSNINFLLFLNRNIGLDLKLELSTKARKDTVSYYLKKNAFFFFYFNQKTVFHFNLKNYPVILISNCKEMLVSKKIQNFFSICKSVSALIYVIENDFFYKKLFKNFKKKKKYKILTQEISIFEKAFLYILDRKKRLNL